MINLDWLIIEVSSAPDNTLLAVWLTDLLVSERDMNHTEAARHVAEVQQQGRVAAEMLTQTRPVSACLSRNRRKPR